MWQGNRNITTPWKTALWPKWLRCVQKRNKELTVRKLEPLSSVRAKGLNSQTTGESFMQLYEIYHKYN